MSGGGAGEALLTAPEGKWPDLGGSRGEAACPSRQTAELTGNPATVVQPRILTSLPPSFSVHIQRQRRTCWCGEQASTQLRRQAG